MSAYLIVGAGLTGAVLARTLADAGHQVRVVEARDHIAGNCYDEQRGGVWCNRYGGHIFHTNSPRIWQWANRFAPFVQSQHRVKALAQGEVCSFPINLLTMHRVWGVTTPNAAREILSRVIRPQSDPQANLESWCLSTIGETLYNLFVRDYTTKHWGRDPRELPASIIRRLPIRFSYDDRYFLNCRYEGQPEGGYTAWIAAMLEGIEVSLSTPFALGDQRRGERVIYCGAPDALFGYEYGPLPYRGVHWDWAESDEDTICGPTLNYCDMTTPFTRAISFRHFAHNQDAPEWYVVAYEEAGDPEQDARFTPAYPIRDDVSVAQHARYFELANREGVILAGRMGCYLYQDMDQIIARALKQAEGLCAT